MYHNKLIKNANEKNFLNKRISVLKGSKNALFYKAGFLNGWYFEPRIRQADGKTNSCIILNFVCFSS